MQQEQNQEAKKKFFDTKNKTKELRIRNYGAINDLKELYSVANEFKKNRDDLTLQVKKLKEDKDELTTKTEALLQKMNMLSEEIRKQEKELKIPYFQLQQEYQRLDWELQTEATTPKLEKELSKKIKEVEVQLKKAAKIKPLSDELGLLKKELNQQRRLERDLRDQMSSQARKSQQFHKELLFATERIEKLRKELGEGIQQLDAANQELNSASQEFRQATQAERELKAGEFKEARAFEEQTKQKIREKTEEVKSQAESLLEEFKKGKKLKFDDIQKLQIAGLI